MHTSNQESIVMAIANFAHTQGLHFSIVKSESFRQIIFPSICACLEYKPPGRHHIGLNLLDINYNRYYDTNSQYLIKESDMFGVSFVSDGAALKQFPFLNIFGSGSNATVFVLKIVDGTKHVADWRVKIAHIFQKRNNPSKKSFVTAQTTLQT